MEYLNTILILILGFFAVYINSYMKKKGESLATREELEHIKSQLRETTRIAEETRSEVLRSENAKTEGLKKMMKILAIIEVTLLNWKMFVYFRKDELTEEQTIEEIGRSDLKRISNHLTEFSTVLLSHSIYFSKEFFALAHEYSKQIYLILYSYEAAYRTSIELHRDKEVDDSKRLEVVSNALGFDADVKFKELPPMKEEIRKKLKEELKIG